MTSIELMVKKLQESQNQENSQKKNSKISYKCNECRDTGWILVPKEKSAPLAISCKCRDIEKNKNEWIKAGINVEQSKLTFSNFEVWNESAKQAKNTSLAYFKDFNTIRKNRSNSILFCGQVGGGKTHLSIALALNFLRKGINVVYMPYRDAITKLKQNIMNEENYQRIIQKYCVCDILVIDDLYKGKTSESDLNIIFEIINHRYLNYLPVIVSTELSVDKLLTLDEAIGSRIYEISRGYLVEVSGGNWRIR